MTRIKQESRKDKKIKEEVPVGSVRPAGAFLSCPPVVVLVEKEIIGKEEE